MISSKNLFSSIRPSFRLFSSTSFKIPKRKRIGTTDISKYKPKGKKIVTITAYDFPSVRFFYFLYFSFYFYLLLLFIRVNTQHLQDLMLF